MLMDAKGDRDLTGVTVRTDGRKLVYYRDGEMIVNNVRVEDGREYYTSLQTGDHYGSFNGYVSPDDLESPSSLGANRGSGYGRAIPPYSQYYDFDAIAKANNIRYGMSYSDFDTIIDVFDISRLPDMDGITMPLVGHIIFTRPSLYVAPSGGDGKAAANFSALLNNSMTASWVSDRYGKKLTQRLSEFSGSAYLPLLTTRAMSYQVGDIGIKALETGETYYGHMIKYGHHTQEHKLGGTISIDFRNDRYLSVLRLIYIWLSYIAIVTKGGSIQPSDRSQKNGILDYCGSIYYLVTQMDMSRLVYWEKLTGVFPKTVPLGSIFSYNDAPIVEDKLTVEFEYGMRSDPCDLNILMDLNILSAEGGNPILATDYLLGGIAGERVTNWNSGQNMSRRSRMARPDSFERPFGLGNALSLGPVIKAEQNLDGSMSYFLQWRR